MNPTTQDLSAIILTYNEEKHLARCLDSIRPVCREIFVIDSFSTDKTVEIAQKAGAQVFQNDWINYAAQFQWALDNCPLQSEWLLRIDADEYATPALLEEIHRELPGLDSGVSGVFVNVQVCFLDRIIRYGGHYPIRGIRLWRRTAGYLEPKFMDERILLRQGRSVYFCHDLIDHNLNTLTWWTAKQNGYALREMADLLNQQYDLFEDKTVHAPLDEPAARRRRWLKTGLYNRAPLFLRVFLYFFYRYFLRLGFLDGKAGLIWHFLQGFWLRFLVDAKIYQAKHLARKTGKPLKTILLEDFGLKT